MKEKIQINAEAIELRNFFAEDCKSPVEVFSLLKTVEELTVVFYPMSERISGLCLVDNKNKFIGINSSQTLGRQRFTAAHELCHLYYHENLPGMVCIKGENDKKKKLFEKEANIFASFFLAPYEALNSFIKKKCNKKLEVEDVIKIEQYFGLSRQATLWRLIDDEYLTLIKAETMRNNIALLARRYGYSTDLYFPTSEEKQYITYGKYLKIAEKLKKKNLVSRGKYEELLLDAFRSDIVYGLDVAGEEQYDEKAVF